MGRRVPARTAGGLGKGTPGEPDGVTPEEPEKRYLDDLRDAGAARPGRPDPHPTRLEAIDP